jgi:spoIIIJ-associated protein
VKDQLFSGDDVTEALAAASRAIGVPQSALRYVVLEAGRPGGLGLRAMPARIAVLLGESAPQPQQPAAPAPEDVDVYEGLWAVVGALSEALGRELSLELEEDAGDLRARLAGPACELLLDDDAAALRALEHLLQRVWARAGDSRRLRVDCEGYRERRDEALRARAHDLAAAVRQDGVARTTDPMNAYERRIVHLALDGASGVQTYSVGEGKERRVTVAPAASDEG